MSTTKGENKMTACLMSLAMLAAPMIVVGIVILAMAICA